MDKKVFKSRLFNKSITPADPEYWQKLYAEILFRIKLLDDLNCPCGFCFRDRIHYRSLLEKIMKDLHISYTLPSKNFTGSGSCGRNLGPAA